MKEAKKMSAYESGMRGNEKPSPASQSAARDPQARAREVLLGVEDGQEEAAMDMNDHVKQNEDGSITILPSVFGKKKSGLRGE